MKPELIHFVKQINCLATPQRLVTIGNHDRQVTTAKRIVVEVHPFGQHHVEHDSSVTGFNRFAFKSFFFTGAIEAIFRQPNLNLGMNVDDTLSVSGVRFSQGAESHPFTLLIGQHQRDVVTTHHRVLGRTHDRLTVGRGKNIVGRKHQRVSFHLSLD